MQLEEAAGRLTTVSAGVFGEEDKSLFIPDGRTRSPTPMPAHCALHTLSALST